jgi:2'-5' RNA ligase
MIRTATLALSTETFAAERKQYLGRSDEQLLPHIKDALARYGLPGWEGQIVDAALDVFDTTARSEVDEWNQVLDDMRAAFAHELGETLKKTTAAVNKDAQIETITRWVSTMAVNAATEAATTSDTENEVGLEWVTMHDGDVRSAHKDAEGQTVPSGQEFTVGGEKMFYPGQPVGNPSNWINCRCVARPTMLDNGDAAIVAAGAPGLKKDGTPPKCKYCEVPATQYVLHSEGMAYVPACDDHIDDAKTDAEESVPGGEPDPGNIDKVGRYALVAAADPEQVFTTACIVALPAEDDAVTAASSEADGAHCTLLFFGDTATLNGDALKNALAEFVANGEVGVMAENVSGRGTLGPNKADVVLIDGASLVNIRKGLLENEDELFDAYNAVEQFPTWIPHVTLGYPDTPANGEFAGEQITFDRLALWFGEDRTAIYPLGGTPVSDNAPAPEAVTAAVEDAVPAETAPAAGAAPAPDETPWHGVLAPEGTPSGDGRQFALGALTNRDLPLPLKAMFVDDEGHKGSVVVGRIDNIFRDGNLVKGEGVFDNSPEADKAKGMVERKMWRGVSVDVDAAELSVADDTAEVQVTEFSTARIASATMCAIPAFAEAYVAIGTWADAAPDETAPAPAEDAPEAAPLPAGQKLSSVSLVASAATISADYFRNPMLEQETPLTITEDGRVFGHVAGWETCHIGYEVCTTAPPSATDYAYFLTGQVLTDAGPVAVGQITLGGGHANGSFGVRAAVAHYDNTGLAVADITTGEDEHGIWFSGKLRDGVTAQQVHELRATGVSGDWREVRVRGNASMELIAALSVNVPGFPIARSRATYASGHQVSLIGRPVQAKKLANLDPAFVAQLDAYHAAKTRQEAVAKFRSEVRAEKVASLKTELMTLEGN